MRHVVEKSESEYEEFLAVPCDQQNRNTFDDYRIKANIPPFFDNLKIEDFLDSLIGVERFSKLWM